MNIMKSLWYLPRKAVGGLRQVAGVGYEHGATWRRPTRIGRNDAARSLWPSGAARGCAAAAGGNSGSGTRVDRDDDVSRDGAEGDGGDEELPFPRIGWTPGSFGARALRPSRKRRPGEATGRTKPPRTENDYWHEAGVYNDPKSSDDP